MFRVFNKPPHFGFPFDSEEKHNVLREQQANLTIERNVTDTLDSFSHVSTIYQIPHVPHSCCLREAFDASLNNFRFYRQLPQDVKYLSPE